MQNADQQSITFWARIKAWLDRHRVSMSITCAVLAALAFVSGEIFPKIDAFLLHGQIVQYLTLLLLLDLSVSVYLQQAPPVTQLAKNQDESMSRLIEAASHCRDAEVDLLEYAGSTTLPLVRAVQRDGAALRMLVKHPDTVVGFQKQRMITTLDTIFNSIFSHNPEKCQVRCYRQPFALRGRKLGNEILELGWLTLDLRRQTAYGHANPSIVAELSTRNNDYLREFFDRTFADLWNAEDTEDARKVFERCRTEEALAGSGKGKGHKGTH